MNRYRVAVATNEKEGLEDVVSNVFGRAKTFTIVDILDEKITGTTVVENPGVSYNYGAGPLVAKMLVDENVDLVLACDLGFGAAELLKQHNIKHISIKPSTKVGEAIREIIHRLKKESLLG